MQILKVMNNSLVLALDETGTECVLMGKGIGFKQSIGNPVDDEKIEKVFLLKDKKVLLNFVQLASELDDIYFQLVQKIVAYAHDTFKMEVMDYLYLSLSDHIAFVVRRLENGNNGENFTYIEVINHHREEYLIGKFAVQLINQELNIQLPESEATAIGLHFVNAKLNSSAFQKEQEVAALVKNIERLVTRSLNLEFDKDSFSYSRFLTHLTYFAERVYEEKLFEDKESEVLFKSLQENMPQESVAIQNIQQFILTKYHQELSKQEKIYLLVHLHRLVSEANSHA
ncbi:PRD domain-containing protein [Enterococcus sp. LJL90]